MRYFLLFLLLSIGLISRTYAASVVYVYAHLPNEAVYNARANYTVNATLPVTITRSSEGTYSVYFNRIFDAPGGWSVSKYGNEGGRCHLGFENTSLFQGRIQTSMRVLCYDDNHRLKDSQFTLLRMGGGRYDINSLAYGLAYLARDDDGVDQPRIGFKYPNENFPNTERNRAHLRYYERGYYYAVLSVEAHVDEFGNGGIRGEPYNDSFFLISSFYDSICNGSGNFNFGAILCRNAAGDPAEGTAYYLTAIKDMGNHSTINIGKNRDGYYVDARTSYRSDGGVQSIAQLGLGEFKVTLGPEASVNGHVQLSTHYNDHCIIKRWSGGDVFVTCRRNGEKTNPEHFRLLAIKWPNTPILREEFRGQFDPGIREPLRNDLDPLRRENPLNPR